MALGFPLQLLKSMIPGTTDRKSREMGLVVSAYQKQKLPSHLGKVGASLFVSPAPLFPSPSPLPAQRMEKTPSDPPPPPLRRTWGLPPWLPLPSQLVCSLPYLSCSFILLLLCKVVLEVTEQMTFPADILAIFNI